MAAGPETQLTVSSLSLRFIPDLSVCIWSRVNFVDLPLKKLIMFSSSNVTLKL